jgi:3-oxoadipate enol-lactonase
MTRGWHLAGCAMLALFHMPAMAGIETLRYEVKGDGPAIVLIHDGILHSVTWDAQWEPLSKGHRVIRYDRRGYGRSPLPKEPYSDLDDLRALLDMLKVERATLIGSSAGGNLAIHFALDNPQRVDRLVLVGPVVSGFSFTEHFLERGRANNLPLEQKGDMAATIDNWVKDPWLIAPGNDTAKRRLKEQLTANPRNLRGSGGLARFPDRPALSRLAEIKVPTLIVAGDADIPDVHAHIGAIQAGIAGAKRVVIPKAGHLVYLERPDEFNQVVLGFLAGP